MHPLHKGKISHALLAINIIPMLFFGLAIMLLCSRWFSRIMYAEVEQEMKNIACSVDLLLNTAYPGDYELVGDSVYQLYKGETDITYSYELLDDFNAQTGMEITLFYQDTRILTTIRSANHERFIGTRAPERAIEEVLKGGSPHFYDGALINGAMYFSYYMPVTNSDGSVVGMIFVGKPSQQVNESIQGSIYPLLLISLICMTIMAMLLYIYTKRIVNILLHIRSFLANVATGNLTAGLDPSVSSRNDELGDIGRSAIAMQSSLRTMIEQDALTELFNRRSGDRKLKQIINKYESQQSPFALAIGDIDFFKNINDTYGHDCGDLVLKNIAAILHRHMCNCGFAARWGGEEFLLVFDRMNLEEALKRLTALLDDIRAMESIYEGHRIKITMTFGLTNGDSSDIKALLHAADDRLYLGKTLGRNQIVCY